MSKKGKKQREVTPTSSTITRTESAIGQSTNNSSGSTLLFGKKNFMFLLAGTGLIALGYFLMAGGHMPSPDVWDESLIYSTRRTFIAPLFILAGLSIQVYTIFAKK